MFPKSQSWGKQQRRGGTGGLCPSGMGQNVGEGAESRGFGAGEELRGAAASSPGFAIPGTKAARAMSSHVQLSLDTAATACTQMAPGNLCCSPSSGFGDIKVHL